MRENPIFQKTAKLVINDDFAKNRRDKETDKETQFNPKTSVCDLAEELQPHKPDLILLIVSPQFLERILNRIGLRFIASTTSSSTFCSM